MKDDRKIPAQAGSTAIPAKSKARKPRFDLTTFKGQRGAGKQAHQTSTHTQPVFKPRGR